MSWGKLVLYLCVFALAALWAVGARSEGNGRPLYIIFDSSSSMWGTGSDNEPKYQSATDALSRLSQSKLSDREVFVRVFGADKSQRCNDTKLISSPTNAAGLSKLANDVARLQPAGKSALELSLREAARDLRGRPADVVLITDGITVGVDACTVDPCELVKTWQESGSPIRTLVLDFGQESNETLSCIVRVQNSQIDTLPTLLKALQPIASEPLAKVVASAPILSETTKQTAHSDFWTDVTAAQATLLAAIITVFGTLIGILFGAVFLQSRVSAVQKTLTKIQDDFEILLKKMKAQLDEVNITTKATKDNMEAVKKEIVGVRDLMKQQDANTIDAEQR